MAHRLRRAVLATIALCTVAVGPAAAAGYDSTSEAAIRTLGSKMTFMAVVIGIMTEGALVYAVIRFRDREEASPPNLNSRFHLLFVAAVVLVLLSIGFSAFQVMGRVNGHVPGEQPRDPDAVHVTVDAAQWLWTFHYDDANVTNRTTMVIPANRTVHLNVTSSDVIHSFHSPALGLKQDAIPGKRNQLVFTATDPGRYRVYCAQYCGRGHSNMLGWVRVVNQTTYRQWLRQKRASKGGASSAANGTASSGNATGEAIANATNASTAAAGNASAGNATAGA
ncbi:MAG: cytochrome c oxidase subunit II [Haloarculaceae archaeon]